LQIFAQMLSSTPLSLLQNQKMRFQLTGTYIDSFKQPAVFLLNFMYILQILIY